MKEKKEESNIIQELNDDYYKIKECLARCGNSVYVIKDKKELIKILTSFFSYNRKLGD